MGAEKNVENHIKQSLVRHGFWYTKIFANAYTKKGIPDIIAVIHGQLVALEIKRPTGGKPTPIQIKNLQAIANNGGLAVITNDPHIVDKIISKSHDHVFFQPATTTLLTPLAAAKLWQHPLNQATPTEPYSVIITKEGNDNHDSI